MNSTRNALALSLLDYMSMAHPVNGTGSHWYPSQDEVPRVGPTPQFVPDYMFDDRNALAPPEYARNLNFDRMDPYERQRGMYYRGNVEQPGLSQFPRRLK